MPISPNSADVPNLLRDIECAIDGFLTKPIVEEGDLLSIDKCLLSTVLLGLCFGCMNRTSVAFSQETEAGFGQAQAGPLPTFPSAPPKVPAQRSRTNQNQFDESDDDLGLGEGAFAILASSLLAVGKVAAEVAIPSSSDLDRSNTRRELQFNTAWYFESRTNQPLLRATPSANSRSFDWDGVPGLQLRFMRMTPERSREWMVDYADTSETQLFSNATEFLTFPRITFSSQSVQIDRNARFLSGQYNLVIGDNDESFGLWGFRWWHQRDQLRMYVRPIGAFWSSETTVNSPLLQIGKQFSAKGDRWSWMNRLTGGGGVGFHKTRSWTVNVAGTRPAHSDEEVFTGFLEYRTELTRRLGKHWHLRSGAQLTIYSSRLIAAKQIGVTNLIDGIADIERDSFLMSSLFAGASYRF